MMKIEDTPKDTVKVAASTKPIKIVKTQTTSPEVDYKSMSIEQLEDLAKKLGAEYKHYDNPGIYRMRLVMAIKKVS